MEVRNMGGGEEVEEIVKTIVKAVASLFGAIVH
jgi:hypothetical protein